MHNNHVRVRVGASGKVWVWAVQLAVLASGLRQALFAQLARKTTTSWAKWARTAKTTRALQCQ